MFVYLLQRYVKIIHDGLDHQHFGDGINIHSFLKTQNGLELKASLIIELRFVEICGDVLQGEVQFLGFKEIVK